MPESDEPQIVPQGKLPPSPSQQDEHRRRLTVRAEQTITYNGPLPPPEILEQYARILPDAPERLFKMVENQETHRHHLEKTVVEAGARNAARAVTVTAYISTLFVAASAFMVYEHYVVAGISVLGGTLATLVGANLYGRSSQKAELANKSKLLREDDDSRRQRKRISQEDSPPETADDDFRDTP